VCSFVCAATAATQGLHVKLSENEVDFIYLGMAIEDFKFTMVTSGNRTPGSRLYYELLDTLADFVCIHQLILKRH